jgi:acetylornithine deacetylase/succinyl-diaminopimelate desuccinylase-like protein
VTRRIVPGEDPTEVFHRLAEIAAEACPLPTDITWPYPPQEDGRMGSKAFYQPAVTPLTQSLAAWAGTSPAVAPFGTNALRYDDFARELAVFGPGSIDDAHQATEHVLIDDLVTLAHVYTRWLQPG